MQQPSGGQGPQQAHAATQTTSDIHLRLQLAVQQLKAVDASAFCQHDSCIDAPYASSCYCRTHLGVPTKDAAFCSSCTSWHPAADFSAACHTCRSCQLDQTERMARKRKLDAVMHQEPEQLQGTHAPGVGPVRPHPPSSSAAQQQPEGQPHLLSTSSARSSALDASTGVRLQALASEGTINDASASEVAEYAVWFQDKHDKLGPLPDPNLDNTRGMLEPALVQQQPTPTCLPDTAVRQDKEGAQSCQAISVSTDMLQAGTGAQLPAVQQPKAGVAGGVPSTTAAAAAAAAAAAGALHTWDMPHLDSVASSSERTGGATAPPTAQPAAAAAAAAPPAGGHPVMGPPPLLEQLLPQAAPSVLPPWGPVAGTEGQEGLEQQQQLSDQEQGCSAAALSLLADAALHAAKEPALRLEGPQTSGLGMSAGHHPSTLRGGLTAHPWHPLGGNKVDRGACCWRPGCGRPGQQAQQGRKVRLCELCYNYISDWSDMDGGPPLWGWYNTNKRDVVAARQPELDVAAWAAVDALLQKRRVSSGFITRKREQSIAAGKPYAGFWDKQPYLQGLDSLLSGLGVQPAAPSSKRRTPQEHALLQLLERPAGGQSAASSGGGGTSMGPVIGPGVAGRAAAPPAAAATAGGGGGGVLQAGEIMLLRPTGALPEGFTAQHASALQQQVIVHLRQQQVVKAAMAAASAQGKSGQ